MKQMQKLSVRKLLPVAGLYLLSTGLMLPALISSGYIRVIAAEYCLLTLLYLLLILIVFMVSRSMSSVWVTAASAGLAVGNTAQALMHYACAADEEAAETLAQIIQIAWIHIGCVIAVWFGLAVMQVLLQKHWMIELCLTGAVCLASSAFVAIAGGKNSNTSAVENMQPAIPMAFLILSCFAISLGRQEPLSRLLHWAFCAVMIGVLVIKHELGIPILCILSCALYYLMLYPTPKWMTIAANGTAGLFGIGVFSLRSRDWLTDTLTKIKDRPKENAQIHAVLRTLRSTSLFGSGSYQVYVAAASTDFSLANIIHYAGYLFLILISVLFFLGTLKVLQEESTPHGFEFPVIMRGLCAIQYLVMNTYNLAMSVHMVPLIGSQALFTGKSLSYAFLSAAVLGCITFSETGCKSAIEKLKYYFDNLFY